MTSTIIENDASISPNRMLMRNSNRGGQVEENDYDYYDDDYEGEYDDDGSDEEVGEFVYDDENEMQSFSTSRTLLMELKRSFQQRTGTVTELDLSLQKARIEYQTLHNDALLGRRPCDKQQKQQPRMPNLNKHNDKVKEEADDEVEWKAKLAETTVALNNATQHIQTLKQEIQLLHQTNENLQEELDDAIMRNTVSTTTSMASSEEHDSMVLRDLARWKAAAQEWKMRAERAERLSSPQESYDTEQEEELDSEEGEMEVATATESSSSSSSSSPASAQALFLQAAMERKLVKDASNCSSLNNGGSNHNTLTSFTTSTTAATQSKSRFSLRGMFQGSTKNASKAASQATTKSTPTMMGGGGGGEDGSVHSRRSYSTNGDATPPPLPPLPNKKGAATASASSSSDQSFVLMLEQQNDELHGTIAKLQSELLRLKLSQSQQQQQQEQQRSSPTMELLLLSSSSSSFSPPAKHSPDSPRSPTSVVRY